jgi:hypothetical protein
VSRSMLHIGVDRSRPWLPGMHCCMGFVVLNAMFRWLWSQHKTCYLLLPI